MKSAVSERLEAGIVRPLEERDIPRVAELHEEAFGKKDNASSHLRRARLARVLLEHPWRTESLPSLVFQENGGRVVGCLGVMPRPMSFKGGKILAAISHSFVVEPGSRSTLAALELAKRFIAGPQDLSLAEGGNGSRKIWEIAGGSTSPLYGLCWTRPLRPGRYVLSFLNRRGLPPAVGWAVRPFCLLADALIPLIARKSFRLAAPAHSETELGAESLRGLIAEFTRNRPLRPEYDGRSLAWLLETLAEKNERGTFEKAVVCNARAETLGWYLYYWKRGGMGTVVQMGARKDCAEQVLDHLFYHAKQHGVAAVSGQVDPTLLHLYSRKDCLFHHDGGSWMLVHSRRPELRQAIDRGDAFLSRLEGEWWIGSLLNLDS